MQISEGASTIDLSLAVNYLPACSCAGKSVLLSLALCAVQSLRLAPAYTGLALLLVFDRLLQGRACILDGSSVLMGIFAAHVVCEVQESTSNIAESPAHWMHWAFWALSAEWAALAGSRLYACGGPQARPIPPASSRRAAQQWEFLAACSHVVLFSFYRPPQPEPRGVRIWRHAAFVCLCVSWTYVVGIYLRRVNSTAVDSAVHFASYFWPVLYVHPYVAAPYAFAVLACVALHARSPLLAAPSSSLEASSRPSCPPQYQQAPAPLRLEFLTALDQPGPCEAQQQSGESEESLEELEKVFRQAMLSKSAV